MAILTNTQVNGVTSQSVAASQPTHLVRLGELQSLLANYLQLGSGIEPAQVIGLTGFVDEIIENILQNSESISWAVNSGVPSLIPSVKFKPNGALAADGQGVYVVVGSGGDEVAAGNHSHSGLPILPVTIHNGGTISFLSFDGRQIPAEFQGGAPLQDLYAEVVALTQGGVLATDSGVRADFGPGYNQVARGLDVVALLGDVADLEAMQPTVLSTSSISLSLESSPGLPAGTQFPSLYERAGELETGGWLGGQYVFDCPVQIDRAGVTAMAPSANTVLSLMVGGVAAGPQLVIPSGLPNTEVRAWVDFSNINIALNADGLTPAIRWQCTSGTASIVDAASQVDLAMWATVIAASPVIGSRLSAAVICAPGGGLQVTGLGLGVIYGNQTSDYAAPGTVAPGYHTHLGLHDALTAWNTPSLLLSINAAQQISGSVNVDPSPAAGFAEIQVGPNGIVVVLGMTSQTAAAGNHTHPVVTQSGAGFMSPQMLAELDAAVNDAGQVVVYSRESALSSGVYVGGRCRWPQQMQVIGVNLTAQAPMYDQGLTFEVGGVLQDIVVVIPGGPPGTEVYAELDNLSGVYIPMSVAEPAWTQDARWVCTSGTGRRRAAAALNWRLS